MGSSDRSTGNWSARYGDRHRLVRIDTFPAGVEGPKKVRIYHRRDHFVLQWWDPSAKATLSDRVDGDLVAAIIRAREVENKILHFKSGKRGTDRRLTHAAIVAAFRADLTRRADAGEIDRRTVVRYESALAHYLGYAARPEAEKVCRYASGVKRDFRLGFEAFLATRLVAANGRGRDSARPMQSVGYVLDTTRAMFEWAMDPDRGNLLPDGFRNPFRRTTPRRRSDVADPLAAPDITVAMAGDFLAACDEFQLRLFAPLLFFGLRAGESGWLFAEFVEPGWLRVPNVAALDYRTKGGREKKFPLIDSLTPLWDLLLKDRPAGFLYRRRGVMAGDEFPTISPTGLSDLVTEFRNRLAAAGRPGAAERRRIRDRLVKEAGGLRYDDVESEFASVAKRLKWPRAATVKDFRHLFASTLHNAGIGEKYRKYLMGHSLGRDAILNYTHLDQLREQYDMALNREWPKLIGLTAARAAEYGRASVRNPLAA
jgi:hypothetical protein